MVARQTTYTIFFVPHCELGAFPLSEWARYLRLLFIISSYHHEFIWFRKYYFTILISPWKKSWWSAFGSPEFFQFRWWWCKRIGILPFTIFIASLYKMYAKWTWINCLHSGVLVGCSVLHLLLELHSLHRLRGCRLRWVYITHCPLYWTFCLGLTAKCPRRCKELVNLIFFRRIDGRYSGKPVCVCFKWFVAN